MWFNSIFVTHSEIHALFIVIMVIIYRVVKLIFFLENEKLCFILNKLNYAYLIAETISYFCKYWISLFCFTPQQRGKFLSCLLGLQCNFLHRARVKQDFPSAGLALPEEQHPDLLRAQRERHPAENKQMYKKYIRNSG